MSTCGSRVDTGVKQKAGGPLSRPGLRDNRKDEAALIEILDFILKARRAAEVLSRKQYQQICVLNYVLHSDEF